MKVSIVIPAYNEERTIKEVVNQVAAAPVLNLEKEIIVVNDCSKDSTKLLLDTLVNEIKNLRVFHEPVNRGKGAALRRGFQESVGDIVIVQDADLEYSPNEYEALLGPIVAGHADVVYGSRFIGSQPHRVLYFKNYLANKLLTFLSDLSTGLNLTDMETGYKVFRKKVLSQIKLEEDRFGFEPEVTAKISRIPGIRVYEMGISYHGRSVAEGKKIGWKDGVRALFCIVKYGLFS